MTSCPQCAFERARADNWRRVVYESSGGSLPTKPRDPWALELAAALNALLLVCHDIERDDATVAAVAQARQALAGFGSSFNQP